MIPVAEEAGSQAQRTATSLPVKVLVIGAAVLAVANLLVSIVILAWMTNQGRLPAEELDPTITIAFVLLTIVGALATLGQPRNVTGWILLASGLITSIAGLSAALGQVLFLEGAPDWMLMVASWLANFAWIAGLSLLLVIFPFFFPDGRPPAGRFWRTVTIVAVAYFLFVLGYYVAGGAVALVQSGTMGLPEQTLAALDFLLRPLVVLAPMAGLSLFARYRQAPPDARRQLKWLVLTLSLALIGFAAAGVIEDNAGIPVSPWIWGTLYLSIPLGLGVALFRYRLWDVDTVIRRTSQYAILTLLLVFVYAILVLGLQQLFSSLTGQTSTLAIVLSTLAIAALFQPLRRRVQEVIDKRFFRQKYDAELVLSQFATTVRDETDLDALTAELVRVIQDTMQPAAVTIWLAPPDAPEIELPSGTDPTS